ncbi:protein kinase domain-containing protein (plasmid) [Mycolicibacterium aichiense]|uniref:protein kinase domain-containing protein n=1 Tax=Mycolicibacterium aichiense TaxID=1799 RepID=UPI003D67A0DA
MLTAGSSVGGYRVEKLLGSGGMGAVYLAANPTLPRRDALKVLSAELSRDRDFRARFIREAEVASALDHPNIVAVYNRGETEGGQLWIAMQFVDGTDADDALRAGTMTPQRAVHIIGEVAKALDHAHARHVVHRDVKPANFLLSGPVGPSERVLLGDFGIARALDDVSLTVTGSVVATVAYAAPEVLSGLAFDGRADVYALGCTLFRLLTGKTPFSSANGMAAMMMAHLQSPPPRVTDFVASLPPLWTRSSPRRWPRIPQPGCPRRGRWPRRPPRHCADRPGRPPSAGRRCPAARSCPTPIPSRPRLARGGNTAAPAPWQRHRRSRRHRSVLPAATAPSWCDRRSGRRGAGAGGGCGRGDRLAPGYRRHDRGGSVDRVGTDRSTVPLAVGGLRHRCVRPPAAVDSAGRRRYSRGLTLESDGTDFLTDAGTVAPADCLGSWAPAQQGTYAGTGATAVAVQSLRAMGSTASQDGVVQAAVAFSTSEAASLFVVNQRGQWGVCGNQTVTVTPPGASPQTWTFAASVPISGVATLSATQPDGRSCQRGLQARGNVILDIRQCTPTGGNTVVTLVNAMADKVPRA